MATCPNLSTGDTFLSTLLRHIDCQGQTIGTAGYQALADPASPLALTLTALLTVFIALFGLRMVLGETPTLREGVLAAAKIGVVLVIATSWPAFRTVVYDVVVSGPGQLVQVVSRSTGLPGAGGDLIARLQISDLAISRLTTLGSGRSDLTSREPIRANSGDGPPKTPLGDDPAFGSARVLFMSAAVASFAIVRLMAGLLLALGPLFASLLLFDVARGLFVGWVRALVFTMLASIAATIVLGVQLSLLEPWLAQVLQLRYDEIVTASAPIELLVICLAFALALAGAFGVLLRLAFTVDVQVVLRRVGERISAPDESIFVATPKNEQRDGDQASPRVQAVAGAVLAAQRREQAMSSRGAIGPGKAFSLTQNSAVLAEDFAIPRMGQAFRRTRPRKSVGAAIRDRRT